MSSLLGFPPCPALLERSWLQSVSVTLRPPKRCFVILQPSVTSAAHGAFHKSLFMHL